jgi:hypothetical protein
VILRDLHPRFTVWRLSSRHYFLRSIIHIHTASAELHPHDSVSRRETSTIAHCCHPLRRQGAMVHQC